jgi:hypothetical protein
MALTAGTPLDVLTTRLQVAGWGDLGTPELRGLGRVLQALGLVLDRRSGAGKVTAHQLAGQTGYTERWVRRCLGLLEELEVIEWHRGGIVQGKPTPSWVRVSKAVLVDLIHIARAKQDTARTERSAETRRRVARLRTSYTLPGRGRADRKRSRSGRGGRHAEVVTALLLNREVPQDNGPDGPLRTDMNDEAPASTDTARSIAARIRADLAARRGRGAGEKRSEEGRRGPG